MKKLLAILLAVGMIMGLALTASAKETTLPDLDCSGWWTAHTEGVEVTEDGVTITFTNTTYATASANWNSALWVLYTGNEAKVMGDGYVEYWVHRSDNYGWGNAGYYTAELPVDTWLNTAYPDNLAANNITWEGAFEDGCWDNWVADSQAGATGTVTAKLEGSNAVVSISYHGVTNTLTLPVDTSKPVYLSLTGELTALSNIVVTTPDPVVEPSTPAEDTVTEIYVGDGTANSGWYQTADIYTSLWSGALDPSFLAEGGYVTVNFSTEDISQVWQIRLVLNGKQWTEMDWHVDPTSVANPIGTLNDLGNGNYSVTFAYDDIVAVYGTDDFAGTLGALVVATNAGVPVTLGNVTYTVPAPEADNSNPKDGDSIAVVFALLAVSAAGIAVVAKKKEF